MAAKEPQGRKARIILDSVFHRQGRELQRDFRMGQMLGSPVSVDALHATEVIVNVFDGGPRTTVDLTIKGYEPGVAPALTACGLWNVRLQRHDCDFRCSC